MGENDPRASLKELGDRLDKARGGIETRRVARRNGIGDTQNALGQGLRIGVELVVAVVVSVGHRLGARQLVRHQAVVA